MVPATIELSTERLQLVPYADEHLDALSELNSDPEIMRYISGRAADPRRNANDDRTREGPLGEMRIFLVDRDRATVGRGHRCGMHPELAPGGCGARPDLSIRDRLENQKGQVAPRLCDRGSASDGGVCLHDATSRRIAGGMPSREWGIHRGDGEARHALSRHGGLVLPESHHL